MDTYASLGYAEVAQVTVGRSSATRVGRNAAEILGLVVFSDLGLMSK